MKHFFLMFVVLCFAACGGDNTETSESLPKDPIDIPDQPAPPVFPENGGSSSYRFTAKTNWTAGVTATRAADWCSVSPTSGGKGDVTLSIVTKPNDTPDERNATITLRAGETKKTFAVTQKQKDALTLTSAKIEMEAAGGMATVEVKANISFEYEIGADCKEWVTYKGTRAMQTSHLEFTVAENDDTSVREGTITIRSSEGSETVKIYQAGGAPTLVLTQKEYTVAAAGETIKVELKSNVEYTVTMPQASWIKESTTRAMSTHTLYYTISPNEEYDGRTAEIVFTNKANNLTQKVTITQVQKDAIVLAKSEYEFGADGGVLDFDVMTNVELTVAISPEAKSWITQVQTRGLEKKSLHFDIAAGSQDNDRTGTISITGGGITQKVTVTQSGRKEILEKERAALVAFYNATGGKNWKNNTNWCSDRPIREWYGIIVHNNRVVGINLDVNNLSGTLPEEIGDLTELTLLSLQGYGMVGSTQELLRGPIPESIGKLTKLENLSLLQNEFSGPIPKSIGQLKKLRVLSLHRNQLTGGIPEEIWDLTNLIHLLLGANRLVVGELSEKIGNLTALEHLGLEECGISSIPNTITNCSKLHNTYFDNNNISELPSGFHKLLDSKSSGYLHNIIALEFNRLQGVLPSQIVNHKDFAYYAGMFMAVQQESYGMDWSSITIPAVSNSYPSLSEGATINLAQEYPKNEYTLLLRWAEWCQPSRNMIPIILDSYKKYKAKGFDVIGAYFGGDKDERERFLQSSGIDVWQHFIENETQGYFENAKLLPIFTTWGLYGTPFGVLVDKAGHVVWVDDSPNQPKYDPKIPMISKNSFHDLEAFLKTQLGEPEDPDKPYESKDYSADGKVTILQKATRGNGINIVLMGDAYSDRLIADRTYAQTMRKAIDYFFTEEPYKSFRDCFNVYSVNAVSKNEEYGTGMQTALEGYFGGGTRVGGSDMKCIEYASRVPGITDNNLSSTLIVVMMNRKHYAGTCYMYHPSSEDYSQGLSVSYFSYLDDKGFEEVLHHEAGGHGFPKLADEYAYQNMGTISSTEIGKKKQNEPYGWWKNADFTGDVTKVKWAKFISDPRYAAEAVGAYEGGLTYWSGVWRPTVTSIMRYNTGGFNAPSREAIYYRINKLAFGSSWTYNYEDFVTYDAINRTGRAPMLLRTPLAEPKNFVPLHPPVVVMEKR